MVYWKKLLSYLKMHTPESGYGDLKEVEETDKHTKWGLFSFLLILVVHTE